MLRDALFRSRAVAVHAEQRNHVTATSSAHGHTDPRRRRMSSSGPLRALPLLTLSATDVISTEEGGPRRSWIQVAKTGSFVSPVYGKFSITAADLDQMVTNFHQVTPEAPYELSVDYNHLAVDPQTPEQGRAAGWVKDVELRENGTELWALVEWTDTAAEMIAAKEYRYVSAHFSFKYVHTNGKEIGATLLSIGITNRPFLEGMEPMTIAASKDVAFQLAVDAETGNKFSQDEIRRRLSDAVRATFGAGHLDEYGCCACWLCDVFADYVVYRCNDAYWRADYTFAADGAVSFTGPSVEVVNAWSPVAAALHKQENTTMATIKLTSAQGASFEVDEAEIDRLLAARPSKDVAQLRQQLDAQGAEIRTLTAANAALASDLKERDVRSRVDAAIALGKVAPASKDRLIKLGKRDDELFGDEMTEIEARQPGSVVKLAAPAGSDGDAPAASGNPLAEVDRLVADAMSKDAKLSKPQATDLVFSQRPDLYDRYRKESSIRV